MVTLPDAPVVTRAIATIRKKLAARDLHLGRAFIAWVRGAYSHRPMPRALADYFERGAEARNIPTSVLVSYGALAEAYLEQPHGPVGLRVQAHRLTELKGELRRRLARN